jgi:hypothetical protein
VFDVSKEEKATWMLMKSLFGQQLREEVCKGGILSKSQNAGAHRYDLLEALPAYTG